MGQEEGEAGDAEVCGDADGDQPFRRVRSGQTAHDQGAGEGHELGQQEGQEQVRAVEAQSRSVGGGHVNDGIDAVDIEEEGQEEEKDLLVPDHFLQGMAQSHQEIFALGFPLQVVDLLIGAKDGHAHDQPPEGDNDEGDGHGLSLAHADLPGLEDQDKADDKGQAASDIAPGEAAGGNGIHPVFGGDIGQHGIIDDQTELIANPGNDEDHQEHDPAPGQAHGQAACGAQEDDGHKEGLFAAPAVGKTAQNRAQNGYDQRGKGDGVAPEGQIVHGRDALGFRQGIEEDRDQCRHQQCEG